MKKITILFIVLFAYISLKSQTADPPAAGDGSSDDPYQIATLNNLYWVTQNSGEWRNYFIQTADIDASSTSTWDGGSGFKPIGNYSKYFSGSYNGNGKIITNLYIDRSSTNTIGFFGYVNGSITNVVLTDVNIKGHSDVGGLAGYFNGDDSISNCHTSGSITLSYGSENVGGLIGYSFGTIDNCYSTVTIDGNLINSYRIGGLVGFNNHNLICSYSEGSVYGYSEIGGLAGRQGGWINNCYSKGLVVGNKFVGGLVGYNYANYIGNSYSTGSVIADDIDLVGGLVGVNDATVENSFWDTQTSGQSLSAGGTGKTTAEMKTLSTYTNAGWDFEIETANGTDDYWDLDYSETINDGYSYLSWEDGADKSLSVELTIFSARCKGATVILEWLTESELHNLGFILERSDDNKNSWQIIASYKTHDALKGQGNTSTRTEYRYTDICVDRGKGYYYRLSDVDTRGAIAIHSSIYFKLDELPKETLLEKAYPNPFNPQTYFTYHLTEDTDVKISVFDLLGRAVKVLYGGYQYAGSYHVYWHGTNENGIKAPSGGYIIRMETENTTQTQKVMLMK